MNSIEFRLKRRSDKWRTDEMRALIDGRDLVDLAKEYEAPFAEAEDSPSIAGKYSGLSPRLVLPPSRHLYGEPDPIYEYDGKVEVLSCGNCGEPGCWPLVCEIVVTVETVTWKCFEQVQRTGEFGDSVWRYDEFGPFVFERGQFEEALSLLADGAI